jgi:hypothetical protein
MTEARTNPQTNRLWELYGAYPRNDKVGVAVKELAMVYGVL